jgi:uncharacterized membrane protein YdjX (TVP38/TMEM64 family)
VRYPSIWRGLLLIATLCLVGYVVHALRLNEALDTGWMDHWVRGRGLLGEAVFIGAGALLTAIGFPRQVLAFFAGYAFGALLGLGLGVVATTIGAAFTFLYARLLARKMVEAHFPRHLQQIDAFTRDAPFMKTVAIRLLPVGSNVVTSLVAGVSSISMVAFLSGSALGFVPQTFIFALAGSGVTVQPMLRIGVSVILFVISAVIGIHWYRRLRRTGKGNLDALDAAPVAADVQPK